jgi:hypothetical protein
MCGVGEEVHRSLVASACGRSVLTSGGGLGAAGAEEVLPAGRVAANDWLASATSVASAASSAAAAASPMLSSLSDAIELGEVGEALLMGDCGSSCSAIIRCTKVWSCFRRLGGVEAIPGDRGENDSGDDATVLLLTLRQLPTSRDALSLICAASSLANARSVRAAALRRLASRSSLPGRFHPQYFLTRTGVA